MTTTLNELKNWMIRMNNEGCSIPIVINGGGFSWITPSDNIDIILDGENYADDVTVLSKGEEFADFKSCMREEYDDMTFILIRHNNGYNEENCDIQIGVWDYNFQA